MNTRFWIRILLINLSIVALIGVLMRYKIAFPFPHFNQKYLQEAHSHFAFSGWISQTIYVLIIQLFRSNLSSLKEKTYQYLLMANLVCAYGMLVAFAIQGYGTVSIFFASASLVIGYAFSYIAYLDAIRLERHHPSKNWIKAAIVFGILSTIGTIVLSHMMATKQYDQTTYLGSVFLYLHFQYNGWFMFACFALFLDQIKENLYHNKQLRFAFWAFVLSGIPAYFLSTLWARIPDWLYVLVVLAAISQMTGWWLFIRVLLQHIAFLKQLFQKVVSYLFLIVALALTLKLLLQLASTIPFVSKLAFGFRPIVIAYLHLVLLLILTVFLLTFLYHKGYIRSTRLATAALFVFVIGVILNETVLATEGIAAFSYTIIPWVNEILFVVAIVIATGAIGLIGSQLGPRSE